VHTILKAIAEATRLSEEASRIYRQTGGLSGNRQLLPRAQLLIAIGREREAADMLEQAASYSDGRSQISNPGLLFALSRAESKLAVKNYDEAIRMATEVMGVVERNASRASMQRFESLALITKGKALLRTSRPVEALPLLERAAALSHEIYDPEKSLLFADAKIALAECMANLGDIARARALLVEARRIHSTHGSVGEQFARPLRQMAVRVR
jgi:tetratricopeptide (TPR) repeat protein